MPKVTLVFGLSGVGKSWLCTRFAQRGEALHVSASGLLRAAKERMTGQATTSEQLRTGAVLSNQDLLVKEFNRLRETSVHQILFDGHNLIDAGDQIIEVPFEIIASLRPDGMIFVRSDADVIRQRRSLDLDRERPVRDTVTLEQHQQRGISLARDHAEALGVPIAIIEAGDELAFLHALEGAGQH
ncbi:ATP-binding protein [Methylorubrum thiocyanatum]|uniref:ATP-binding protein n=1 Tax=Methylorubrum thiocyanatum TaxID=47958 RepID=UPI00383A2B07